MFGPIHVYELLSPKSMTNILTLLLQIYGLMISVTRKLMQLAGMMITL